MGQDTYWFERGPGSVVAASTEEPGMLLLGASVPDWVRVPMEIEPYMPGMGGQKLRVLGTHRRQCPLCDADCRAFDVDQGFMVIECLTHNFMWCRKDKP